MSKDWKKDLEEYIARATKKQHLSDKFLIAVASDEFKAKRSAIQKGKKTSKETLAKLSAASTGKTHSAETKAKLSVVGKRKTLTEETKAKLSAANKGKILTEEHKAKISAGGMGKIHSEEAKLKMRKPKTKVTCPHCNKTGGNSLMVRYHFDNCKLKRD
jgi:hypothetical protein